MTTLTLPPTQSAHTGSLSIGQSIGQSIGITGAGGGGGAYFATNASTIATIAPSDMTGKISISGTNPDLVIGDKSMVTWMKKVEERLCILEPKKELLEKYEALQQAYSQYKMLEALLHEEK